MLRSQLVKMQKKINMVQLLPSHTALSPSPVGPSPRPVKYELESD